MNEFLWELETPLLIVLIGAVSFFLYDWYFYIAALRFKEGRGVALGTLCFLPLTATAIILSVLNTMSAPDVVNNSYYILFYAVMGLVFVMINNIRTSQLLDISWKDDVVSLNNKAALFSVAGGIISAAIMYSAMSIGDGDGWWCVVVPYALCWGLWFLLAAFICSFAKVSEQITVNRNYGCGMRFGVYLIVSSLIIARANAGDWTSFTDTIYEFFYSWPVLILTALAFVVEVLFAKPAKNENYEEYEHKPRIVGSVFICLLYIALGGLLWSLLPPLVYNTLK